MKPAQWRGLWGVCVNEMKTVTRWRQKQSKQTHFLYFLWAHTILKEQKSTLNSKRVKRQFKRTFLSSLCLHWVCISFLFTYLHNISSRPTLQIFERLCKNSPENLNLNLMKVKEKPTIRRAQVKIWRQRRACSCKMMSGLRMRHGTTVIFWVVSLMDAQDSTLLLN